MCECIKEINQQMAHYGAQFDTVPIGGIEVIKLALVGTPDKSHGFNVIAAYCPICGEEYADPQPVDGEINLVEIARSLD